MERLPDLQDRWKAVPFSNCSNVFVGGEFNEGAAYLCVGEALGADEILKHRPFTGDAGQRLRTSLANVGIDRKDVSFCNVIPRRPLDASGENRTPDKSEIKTHTPFLLELIQLVRPKIVLLLGNVALKALTNRSKITDEHGSEFTDERFPGIIFVPTYHPALTLYRPGFFHDFEKDLKWAVRLNQKETVDLKSLPQFPVLRKTSDFIPYLDEWKNVPFLYVDLEAGAEPPVDPGWHWDPRVKIVLVSIGWIRNEEYVLLSKLQDKELLDGLRQYTKACVVEWNEETKDILGSVLESGIPVVGQSFWQFDFPLMRAQGVETKKVLADTYLIGRLLNENDSGGLKSRLRHTFGFIGHTPYRTRSEEDRFHSRWYLWDSMSDEEKTQRIHYSALDSWGGVQDWLVMERMYQSKLNEQRLYNNVLVPACAATTEMERTGIPVNVKKLWRMALDLSREICQVVKKIQDTLPPNALEIVEPPMKKRDIPSNAHINPGSTQQIAKILFTIYGLPSVKLTEKRSDSTDEDALLRLISLKGRPEYPPEVFDVLELILTLREKQQLMNMFVEPWMNQIKAQNPDREWRKTGIAFLHGRFHVGGTDTLRLSSSDPNLQNCPPVIRKLVEAPHGKVIVHSDFNALELRGAADLSRDHVLVNLLRANEDVHWVNTREFMELPQEALRNDHPSYEQFRYTIKTAFFGSIYAAREQKISDVLRKKLRSEGIGVEQVRQMLSMKKIDPGEEDPFLVLARTWLEWMFKRYAGLSKWHRDVKFHLMKHGEIKSWFGYTRHLSDAKSKDWKAREEAIRIGINFSPQNLSILTLLSFRELMRIRKESGADDWKAMAQVHDSIDLLCDEEQASTWAEIVKMVMENQDPDRNFWQEFGTKFIVPLVTEVSIKQTWG